MARNDPAPTSDDDFNPDEFEKTRAPRRSSSAKSPLLKDTRTRPMPNHVDRPNKDIKTRPMPSKVDRPRSKTSSSKADRSQSSTALKPEQSVISSFKNKLSSSSSSSQAKPRPIPLADRPSRDSNPKPQKERPRINSIPESRQSNSKHEDHSRRDQDQIEFHSKSESRQGFRAHNDDSRSRDQGTRPALKTDRTWEQDKTQFMPKTSSSRDPFHNSSKVASSTQPAQKFGRDQSRDSFRDRDYTRPIQKSKRDQSRDSLREPNYTRTSQTADRDQSRDDSHDSTRVSYPSRPMPLVDRPQSSRPQTRIPEKLKTFFATSRAPKTAISKHTTHEDQEFAARQTEIEDLPPRERELQDQWVQRQLEQFANTCPMAFKFRRVEGGYLCDGGSHKVTDELLAEGKGGMMFMPRRVTWIGGQFGGGIATTNYTGCFGPYYPEEEFGKFGVYQYYGPMPQPDGVEFYMTGSQFGILRLTDTHLAQVGARMDVINLQKRLESDRMAAGFGI